MDPINDRTYFGNHMISEREHRSIVLAIHAQSLGSPGGGVFSKHVPNCVTDLCPFSMSYDPRVAVGNIHELQNWLETLSSELKRDPVKYFISNVVGIMYQIDWRMPANSLTYDTEHQANSAAQ